MNKGVWICRIVSALSGLLQIIIMSVSCSSISENWEQTEVHMIALATQILWIIFIISIFIGSYFRYRIKIAEKKTEEQENEL